MFHPSVDLLTGVAAGNTAAAGRAVSQDLARIALDINNGGTAGADGARGARSSGVGESNGAKIGKGDERAALLKVLDDPLGVGLAKSRWSVGEGVGNRLSGGEVLKSGNAGGLGRGIDGHADLVADLEGEAGEAVGVVGNPLVPSIEAAITIEGDTSLEDCGLASVTINSYPCRGRRVGTTRNTRNCNCAGNLGESLANLDSASPVGGVLGVLGVPLVGKRVGTVAAAKLGETFEGAAAARPAAARRMVEYFMMAVMREL